MRIRDTKRVFFNFLPYECAAVEEYLVLMAEKGWLLQSIKGPLLKFKKIELKKIKYSVDVLHEVSIFDRKDSDVALEYREYCLVAGWNYICQKGKIQIFYTQEDKKTISIHTDENEKFKSVFKASLYDIGSQFFSTLLVIFILKLQLFSGATDLALGSNLGLFSVVAMFSLIIINTIEIISFFLWVIKASSKLKANKFMPYNSYKKLRIKNIFKNAYGLLILFIFLKFLIFDNQASNEYNIFLLMIICIPAIILIYVKGFINKKRYSKTVNMVITISSMLVSIYLVLMFTGVIVFKSITIIDQSKISTDKVSLSLVDFGYKENDDTSPYISFDKSILAKRVQYSSNYQDNYLDYTIFQSQYPWVIKFDENRLLNKLNKYGVNLKQEDSNLPSNIKVYSDGKKRSFVLVSQDKVVDITKDITGISDYEFLNKVYKKLFND